LRKHKMEEMYNKEGIVSKKYCLNAYEAYMLLPKVQLREQWNQSLKELVHAPNIYGFVERRFDSSAFNFYSSLHDEPTKRYHIDREHYERIVSWISGISIVGCLHQAVKRNVHPNFLFTNVKNTQEAKEKEAAMVTQMSQWFPNETNIEVFTLLQHFEKQETIHVIVYFPMITVTFDCANTMCEMVNSKLCTILWTENTMVYPLVKPDFNPWTSKTIVSCFPNEKETTHCRVKVIDAKTRSELYHRFTVELFFYISMVPSSTLAELEPVLVSTIAKHYSTYKALKFIAIYVATNECTLEKEYICIVDPTSPHSSYCQCACTAHKKATIYFHITKHGIAQACWNQPPKKPRCTPTARIQLPDGMNKLTFV
jgi:hypothetical protein